MLPWYKLSLFHIHPGNWGQIITVYRLQVDSFLKVALVKPKETYFSDLCYGGSLLRAFHDTSHTCIQVIIGHVCATCGLHWRGANFLVVCQEFLWNLSHYMRMQQKRSRQAGTQRQQLEDIFGIPNGIWKHEMHSQTWLITIITILYGPLLFQLLLLIFNNIMGDYMKCFFT